MERNDGIFGCLFIGRMDKGKISFIRCQLVDEWEDDGQEMTSLISYFPPFVADLVDGQRRARPQFGGRF